MAQINIELTKVLRKRINDRAKQEHKRQTEWLLECIKRGLETAPEGQATTADGGIQ
jgi:hypothetical protein